jgi:hypothetical protein
MTFIYLYSIPSKNYTKIQKDNNTITNIKLEKVSDQENKTHVYTYENKIPQGT